MKRTFALLWATLSFNLITNTIICQAPAIEWARCYGSSGTDIAYEIKKTSDSGYIIVGRSDAADGDVTQNHGYSDLWIIKIDNEGTIEWEKSLGGSNYDCYSNGQIRIYAGIELTHDGGYIIATNTTSNDGDVSGNHGESDYWIVKVNSVGDIQWQKCYGGTYSEYAMDIEKTSDGGYIVVGTTNSNNGDVSGNHNNDGSTDIWVIKINDTGELQWQKCLGGSFSESASSVRHTPEGGYIIAGHTRSIDGDVSHNYGENDCWVIKLNGTGNIEWEKTLGGSEWEELHGNSIEITSDNGYILAGTSESSNGNLTNNNGGQDYMVTKLSVSGEIEWSRCYGGSDKEEAYSIKQTYDGGYIIAGAACSIDGDVSGNNGILRDYWIVKIGAAGALEWETHMGGSVNDWAYSIIEESPGSYIIAGYGGSSDGDIVGGHGGADAWVVKLTGTVGMDEEPTTHINTTSIYPNPASAHITLSNIARGSIITIHDSNGKLMHEAVVNDTQAIINTTQYASGVYMVQVKHNNTKETHRLVID